MSQSSVAVKEKWAKKMAAEGRCSRCGYKPDPEMGEKLNLEVKGRPQCDICRFKYLRQQKEYSERVRKRALKSRHTVA